MAGIVVFREGKKIKKVEGIPVEEEEVEGDVEKGQESLGVTKDNDGKVDGKSRGEKTQNGMNGEVVVVDGASDAGRLDLTRTRTEKTKGKHWYERH